MSDRVPQNTMAFEQAQRNKQITEESSRNEWEETLESG